jgi:argininosuccinate lyase
LFREDIEGSLGWAEILMDSKLITKEEFEKIQDGFKDILEEWETGKIIFKPSDEDVHTVNERRLTELIGDVGRKLHVGRSRNEQTVVDVKLWMKKSVKCVLDTIMCLISTIIEKAENNIEILMPGYTHLQRAQPVKFSHWLLSYAFFLQSDAKRLRNLMESLDYCPLGSGAIAGNPFGIDREKLSRILGFKDLTGNSMHAVSDRDFVGNFL